jgi:hypothetical protein
MKILFLDIDGVLNTYKENYKPVDYLDKNKIALLKRIIDETKCKIVISSSWRFDKTLMESFYTQLEECNIKKDNFIGHTPHLENYYAKKYRSDEILDWLTQNTVEKFAVLDWRPLEYSRGTGTWWGAFSLGALPGWKFLNSDRLTTRF